ncbi:MAG: hypothetical protein ACE5JS_14830 [Nitrospinota bacterium]
MARLNFTLDGAAVRLLDRLARKYYSGNKSLTVRRALESLAAHAGHEGWRVAGYTPVVIDGRASCHTCGETHRKGDVLYRPVFERGEGPRAFGKLPKENWLDCLRCVEEANP